MAAFPVKICQASQFGGRHHQHTLTEGIVKLFVHSFLHFKQLYIALYIPSGVALRSDHWGSQWLNRAVTLHSGHSRNCCATGRIWDVCLLSVALMQQGRTAAGRKLADDKWCHSKVQLNKADNFSRVQITSKVFAVRPFTNNVQLVGLVALGVNT